MNIQKCCRTQSKVFTNIQNHCQVQFTVLTFYSWNCCQAQFTEFTKLLSCPDFKQTLSSSTVVWPRHLMGLQTFLGKNNNIIWKDTLLCFIYSNNFSIFTLPACCCRELFQAVNNTVPPNFKVTFKRTSCLQSSWYGERCYEVKF